MAFRLYITPAIGTGTIQDRRRPKYISDLSVSWGGLDYGFQPVFLVAADLSAAQDASVIANSDVFAFPFDLATTVGGGNVNTARNALEAALIPGQWIAGSMTWREVARIVAGMFSFMQRLNGVFGNTVVIDTSEKLNIQWGAVPTNIQNGILAAAQSLGLDTSFIQSNTQLRAILKTFADSWSAVTFQLHNFSF